MNNKDYEELKTQLEKDYFVVRRGPAWYALAGAITALIALFGITLVTVRSAIKSQAEVIVLQALVRKAGLLTEEIEDEKEAAVTARAAIEEIRDKSPDTPAEIARIDIQISGLKRALEIERELPSLVARRDKIEADTSRPLGILSGANRKKALKAALAKNKGYASLVTRITELEAELKNLKKNA